MSQQVIEGQRDDLHGLEFGLDSSWTVSTSDGAKHDSVSVIIPGLERDSWLRRGFCFAHRCGTVTVSQQRDARIPALEAQLAAHCQPLPA